MMFRIKLNAIHRSAADWHELRPRHDAIEITGEEKEIKACVS